MKKAGSRESGSNCERTKSSAQMTKKKGTVRQTRKPAKQQKPPEKMEKEKEKPKKSVRKKVKSNSTTVSTDTNKSSDKNHSKDSTDREVPDEQSSASISNNRMSRTPDYSKEDASNVKTSVEQNSKSKATRTVTKTSEEKEEVSKKEEKKEENTGNGEKEERIPEKEDKKFNMHLAQLFFKRMMESQKTKGKMNKNLDPNLEVMPEPIYVPVKPKAVKPSKSPSRNLNRKPRPLDHKIFKPNGEPVWIAPILDTAVEGEDGVWTKYPVLMKALSDDKMQMDDYKFWKMEGTRFFGGDYGVGMPSDINRADASPYGSFDELEVRSEEIFKTEYMKYNTLSNLWNYSKDAVQRSLDWEGLSQEARERHINAMKAEFASKESTEKEKACPVTSITFSMDSTFSISYDRRHPILSIQKFRQKYQKKVREAIEKARKTSRETSRERASKENA